MISERAVSDTARPRVLVADDNAEMRLFIRRLLSDQYDVEVVADGRDSARRHAPARPELRDHRSRDAALDGFALLKAIRAGRCHCARFRSSCSRSAARSTRASKDSKRAPTTISSSRSVRASCSRVCAASLELARMREAVERATGREEALREANRRKDDFLSMLAHELRNPLAPLTYGIHLLGLPVDRVLICSRARARC